MLGLTIRHGFVLGLLVMVTGVSLKHLELRAPVPQTTARQGDQAPREVDFSFVELEPGQPTPVPSYKNGGRMQLYSGDQFEFHVLAADPIPALELHAGGQVQVLPGSDGTVEISGPPNQPLPAVLLAQGSRMSLPGAAPPRIAVKVQVFGVPRPD